MEDYRFYFNSQMLSEETRFDCTGRSQVIYLVVIFLLFTILSSLFIISISVNVKSYAFVRATTEVSIIRAPANGRIVDVVPRENETVQKSEVMFVIESDVLNEKEAALIGRMEDAERMIHDLKHLTTTGSEVFFADSLVTLFYRQSLQSFNQQMLEAKTRYNKAKADYNRNYKLHRERVIADVEFEQYQFELARSKNDLKVLRENQLVQWQSELRTYERELLDLRAQLSQVQKEKENLVIRAPVTGTLQNLAGIYVGSHVFANQELGQISPDTNLIAEAFVKPNDIGLIQVNMPVRFQVDAFNYNQWGLATGKVIEISNDIHIIDNQPVFKVRCSLDQEYLQLKNGYKGYLKKGMTLQARFMVTERTLWQLLYDKMDDWLNPNTFTN
jgi:multidrug resistance efflux pump